MEELNEGGTDKHATEDDSFATNCQRGGGGAEGGAEEGAEGNKNNPTNSSLRNV